MGKPVLHNCSFLMNAHIKPTLIFAILKPSAQTQVSAELRPQVGKVNSRPDAPAKEMLTPGCSICTHGSLSRSKRGHLSYWDY